MGFYVSQKDQVFNPFIFLTWLQPVDRAGRPRDVHRRAQVWLEGRSTGTVDRPESFALWKASVEPRSTGTVDRQRVCSLFQRLGQPCRSTDGTTV